MEVPKWTHEFKNFLKIQLRINKSEKKITFYLRKLISKIQVLNQCKLKDHWVKDITQKTVNTTDIEDS